MHVTEADDRDRPGEGDLDRIEVDFVSGDLGLAGWLRIEVRRDLGCTLFLAAVLFPDEDPVVVLDHELPLVEAAFEFRAPGVWTELVCETPLDHWTVGLEAFGLRVDPSEVITPASVGERVPVGLDLDLDSVGAPEGDAAGFAIDVRIHGEVLVADRAWDLDATGTRRRLPSGVRPPYLLDPAARVIGEIAVGWRDAAGRDSTVRRGWVGGNLPGWVDLPGQSGV